MSPGIDIASYQGSPNWAAVRATGIQFAYVKASEGTSQSYSTLDSQYSGARSVGMPVGLYHFARPELGAEANADAFAKQINRLGAVAGHLPPMLDLEVGSGMFSDWTLAFISRLRARTGARVVGVYSGASFFQTQITERGMDADVVLWIAHYGRNPGQPQYLTPRVAIHQYSSTGRISGINGNVDLNHAIWPLPRLLGQGGPEVTTKPAPAARHYLEEPVANIPITMFSDASFRGYANCEAGNDSGVIDHGWITLGVLYGGSAEIRVTFLAKGAAMGPPTVKKLGNNQDDSIAIPSGCRMVTIEGNASSTGVGVTAAQVLVPR